MLLELLVRNEAEGALLLLKDGTHVGRIEEGKEFSRYTHLSDVVSASYEHDGQGRPLVRSERVFLQQGDVLRLNYNGDSGILRINKVKSR